MGSAISVTASATDSDGTIVSVAFYADGNLLASLMGTNPPYEALLSGLGVGSHVLTVVATDNQGASATSAAVTINVTSSAGSGTVTLQDGQDGYGGTRDNYLSAWNKNEKKGGEGCLYDFWGDFYLF